MHAARQIFYLNKEARQKCTMDTSGTWLQEVHAAKGARALYYTLCDGKELWGAASQGPLKKCSMPPVLSRRSRTGTCTVQ